MNRIAAIRILLIDDSLAFLRAASTYLNGLAGIEVVGSATSAAEGLAQVEALHPDLVLMDVVMPGMNGIDAVCLVKHGAYSPKTVVVSLHDKEAYRFAARTAGADGFIAKAHFVSELPPLLASLFPGQPL